MSHILRILALCVTAAMVCMLLRSTHPQIGTAVAMACGAAALLISADDIAGFSKILSSMEELAGQGKHADLLKLCGVAMVAEFASDICRDAGEATLANRIDVGVRIGIITMAMPFAAELLEKITGLLT